MTANLSPITAKTLRTTRGSKDPYVTEHLKACFACGYPCQLLRMFVSTAPKWINDFFPMRGLRGALATNRRIFSLNKVIDHLKHFLKALLLRKPIHRVQDPFVVIPASEKR